MIWKTFARATDAPDLLLRHFHLASYRLARDRHGGGGEEREKEREDRYCGKNEAIGKSLRPGPVRGNAELPARDLQTIRIVYKFRLGLGSIMRNARSASRYGPRSRGN